MTSYSEGTWRQTTIIVLLLALTFGAFALNPPSNVNATNRLLWPGFTIVTWDPPMQGDTVKLAHCSTQGWRHTLWGSYQMYYGYGWSGGGYVMTFVAPKDSMILSKVRFKLHPQCYLTYLPWYEPGIAEVGVWDEDPSDTLGPGTKLYSEVVTFSVTGEDTLTGWAYVDFPDIVVNSDEPFYVGWIDQYDTMYTTYVLLDYHEPDTLCWRCNAWDSSWIWMGESVNMADGDFAIECYVSGGKDSKGEYIKPATVLNQTKIRKPARSLEEMARLDMMEHKYPTQYIIEEHGVERNSSPTSALEQLRSGSIPLEPTSTPTPTYRARPAEAPTQYRLYRSESDFTDTSEATLIYTAPDSEFHYIDSDSTILGTPQYYGLVADYAGGSSELSEVTLGYTYFPPLGKHDGKKIMLIDWSGGVFSEGWDWDPSDTLTKLLDSLDVPMDSVYVTTEFDRLYGYFFTNADTLLWDLVILSWNPLSSGGWYGPRPREPEYRMLYDYLSKGGQIFIEGADAAEIIYYLPEDTSFARFNLYDLIGVDFLHRGYNSLDTGNVALIYPDASFFTAAGMPTSLPYFLQHISDYGLDEFEPDYMEGATPAITSQLPDGPGGFPDCHFSPGRAVWFDDPYFLYNTENRHKAYTQSVYISGIVEPPSGGRIKLFREIMAKFGQCSGISENKSSLPGAMTLHSNFPNPFNPVTEIEFDISAPQDVELAIYDITGHKVSVLISGPMNEGTHRVTWDGTDAMGKEMGSGIYFYRLTTAAGSLTNKMVLLK